MADRDPEIARAALDPASLPTARKEWPRLAAMALVPLLIIGAAGGYWLSLQGSVSTDNAYVQQDKVSVSAEVGGKIVAVAVREGQMVNRGDLLFSIDQQPYRIQLAQADAAIATAEAGATALSSAAALSGADIAAARDSIGFAQANYDRQHALAQRGFTTRADLEAAEHQLAQAKENLRMAEARRDEARAKLATGAQVPGVLPALAAARAQRRAAELNLARTMVRAPMAGRITQADRLLPGQDAIPNLPVVTIVATQSSYVEANFKETDLDHMKVGQPAKLRFDAYPELELKGHVASIGAGTGSEFSVLPAQNATGNWVKVTQRVPVRIAIDDQSPRQLIAGLSTNVTVYTDGKRR